MNDEFPRKLDPSPSITAEQLRIITLRVALKRAAVVRVFFPSLPHPFHPHPSDFRGLVAVWSILRGDESDGDTRGGEGGGGRGCDASKGLYGYLNTFAINSRERVLEARSRPRNAPILLPFLFSFCPRLSSSPLPSSHSLCLYLWYNGGMAVSRLSADSRLVSAARVAVEFAAGLRKRDGAIIWWTAATEREREGSRWKERTREIEEGGR